MLVTRLITDSETPLAVSTENTQSQFLVLVVMCDFYQVAYCVANGLVTVIAATWTVIGWVIYKQFKGEWSIYRLIPGAGHKMS